MTAFRTSAPDLADLLRTASRTFAIGIEALPAPLEKEVRTAYLLLRVADYLEDDPEIPEERKISMLQAWARTLEGEGDIDEFVVALGPVTSDTPDAVVAARSRDVYSAFRSLRPSAAGMIRQHVCDTCRGMARWVQRGSVFSAESDLDDYMHEVAGRVGLLLTELFAQRSPEVAERLPDMLTLGREFGLGLQTVNVIRGLHEDRHRGWLYVPKSFLPAGVDSPTEVFTPGRETDAIQVLGRLVDKAARHLDAAVRYVEGIPEEEREVRLFCALPLFFAARTLALSRANPRVLQREVKMSRPEVLKVTALARGRVGSNTWVRRYTEKLLAGGRP